MQYSNLYLLAMCRTNVNATAMLLFLHRLLDVFKHYFTEMEEESLRDNFVIAYELLDEVMDFGYPQARAQACCRRLVCRRPADYMRPPGLQMTTDEDRQSTIKSEHTHQHLAWVQQHALSKAELRSERASTAVD